MPCITNEQQAAIADAWHRRAEVFGLKPGTKTYRNAQAHFVAGACQALHVTDPDVPEGEEVRLSSRVPVAWVVNILSGRDPFTTR